MEEHDDAGLLGGHRQVLACDAVGAEVGPTSPLSLPFNLDLVKVATAPTGPQLKF